MYNLKVAMAIFLIGVLSLVVTAKKMSADTPVSLFIEEAKYEDQNKI